jgi:hypothetical protein
VIADNDPWASAAERRDSAPARNETERPVFIPKPKTAQDYIDRATACEQLADAAIAHETRETMLYLAGRWRALADEEEAKQRPKRPEPQHPSE